MKKFKIIILLIVVLAIIAVVLFSRNSSMNTLDAKSDFAVQDTGSITKIFLADKNNNQVLLVKDALGQWTLNEKYKASMDALKLFLKTVMSLDVKSPVPKAAHNNMVKILATSATKVEIYRKVFRVDIFDKIKWFPHEKRTKTFYVGMATQDNMGTYMIMEGADEPFVVYIPGFNGYLSTRFSPYEKDWRDHTVFNYHYKDISSVTVRFPETPEKSFKLVKRSPRDFSLYQLNDMTSSTGTEIRGFDTLKVMDYFATFENIRFEAIVDDLDKSAIDSIQRATPFHILTMEDAQGKISTLKTFHKKGAPDATGIDQKPVLWDRDRLYALINNGKDFVLIQFYVFDPILRPLSYFMPAKKTGASK
jgi:hypothetical protein